MSQVKRDTLRFTLYLCLVILPHHAVGGPELSAAVFGNRHLAKVLATAAAMEDEGELVTTRRIATRTSLPDSVVRAILLRLVQAGVVVATLREGGARGQQYYAITESDVARVVVIAAKVVAEHTSDERSTL